MPLDSDPNRCEYVMWNDDGSIRQCLKDKHDRRVMHAMANGGNWNLAMFEYFSYDKHPGFRQPANLEAFDLFIEQLRHADSLPVVHDLIAEYMASVEAEAVGD